MEYADGGDIFQLIKDSQKDQKLIDEDDIWKIFIQGTRGLRVLHDMKIIHRDLKVINRSLRIDNISVPTYS
jgi:serine/threonine protein kinase